MKKLTPILLAILMISSVSAFSFDDLFTGDLKGVITGKVVDNRDPSVTLSRPVNTQVVNNPVVFKFRYFDPEDDDMYFFILQLDDDPRFFSPENFKDVGTEFKLTLDGGLYYWRVQVVNEFGSSISESWEFSVDPETKVCEDGTPYFECSNNKPLFCGVLGEIRKDCQKCGCDLGANCQSDGSCLVLTCSDGTPFGECASNKPYYCFNGNLREVCNICGCEGELECSGDGSCREIVEIVQPVMQEEQEVVETSFLGRIASFFKRLFTGA